MSGWCPDDDLESVVERSHDDLLALKGARMLVTGGTGFVGTWLLTALLHAERRLDLGLRPLVLTRRPDGFAEYRPGIAEWVDVLEGDVTAMPDPGRVDCVVHAATPASADLNDRDPALMQAIIVDGARSIVDAVTRSGAVPLLFTSSGAVYGPQPADMDQIPETYDPGDAAIDPRNAYAAGKRDAERILAAASAQGGPSLRLARLFAFVGPGLPLDAHFAVGNFVGDAIAGRPITVNGDGLAIRSYMYASDMVVALLATLVRGQPERPYNVGSPDAISIAELAARVRDCLAPGTSVTVAGKPLRQLPTGAGQRYVPDCSRLSGELGVSPTMDLDEAIRRTARWGAK